MESQHFWLELNRNEGFGPRTAAVGVWHWNEMESFYGVVWNRNRQTV